MSKIQNHILLKFLIFRKKELFWLLIIFSLAIFLRFYNLMRDEPYFFNPDERNMATAITQLSLPNRWSQIPLCLFSEFKFLRSESFVFNSHTCNLNPHFFAYGQFPLYLAYASDQIFQNTMDFINQIKPTINQQALKTVFSSAVFWLRFWSALSSTLTVLMVYLIAKKLFQITSENLTLAVIAALMTTFSPGLIQAAHFGTTESFLTFFFSVAFYLSISYLDGLGRLKFIFFSSLTIGLALASKLTGLFFLFPPLFALFIQMIQKRRQKEIRKKYLDKLNFLFMSFLLVLGSLFFFIVFSPYNLIDPLGFKGSVFGYEKAVATGQYQAFYTKQFVNTIPILFQMEKIFPYALGWPVFVMGFLGFLLISKSTIKHLYPFFAQKLNPQKKNKKIYNFVLYSLILIASFLFYFLPNAFLFAKWTRFMTPILPFFALLAAYSIQSISNSIFKPAAKTKSYRIILTLIILFFSFLPGLAFFSIYFHQDSRLQASDWIYKNIPPHSYVLSETANVIDIPVGFPQNNQLTPDTYRYTVISFDFYHLDENPFLFQELLQHLEKADYIFIPSRRIFANYPKIPQKYPLVTKYYQLLFSGQLGFKKVAEISSYPCLLPKITWLDPDDYLPDNGLYRNQNNLCQFAADENAEETFTVFDHPVIRIYKKIKHLTKEQYAALWKAS